MQITTIGLDLAKRIFQVHAVDASGEVVIRKALRRSQVLAFSLGCVDKRDSHLPRVLIQDCFLRSSHGSWGLVGCGMGVDRAAATA